MGTPNYNWDHISTNQAAKEITANGVFDAIDAALTTQLSKALTDADYALTSDEARGNMVFVFTGTLTADRSITLPAQKLYIVSNQTDGGFNLIFQSPAMSPPGDSVSLLNVFSLSPATPAAYKILYSDSVNIVLVG